MNHSFKGVTKLKTGEAAKAWEKLSAGFSKNDKATHTNTFSKIMAEMDKAYNS